MAVVIALGMVVDTDVDVVVVMTAADVGDGTATAVVGEDAGEAAADDPTGLLNGVGAPSTGGCNGVVVVVVRITGGRVALTAARAAAMVAAVVALALAFPAAVAAVAAVAPEITLVVETGVFWRCVRQPARVRYRSSSGESVAVVAAVVVAGVGCRPAGEGVVVAATTRAAPSPSGLPAVPVVTAVVVTVADGWVAVTVVVDSASVGTSAVVSQSKSLRPAGSWKGRPALRRYALRRVVRARAAERGVRVMGSKVEGLGMVEVVRVAVGWVDVAVAVASSGS